MKRRRTLFWDFFLALLLILPTIAYTLCWYFTLKVEQVLDEHLSAQLRQCLKPAARMFSARLLSLLRPEEETKLSSYLRDQAAQLLSLLRATSIVVLDRQLRVVVAAPHTYPMGQEYPMAQVDSLEIKRSWQGEVATSTLYHLHQQLVKTGYAPIQDEEGQVVYILCVEIGASRQEIAERFRQLTIYVSLLGIGLALVVSLLLWSSVTYPLRRLTQAMKTVSQHIYPEKIPRVRTDEIGFLIESFNAMVESLKKKEAELFEMHQRELKRQEHLAKLGEFSAGIAHEIRNPLAAMEGFAELLMRKTEQPETRNLAGRLILEIHALNEIVGQILTYVREVHYEPKPVSIFSFLEEVLSLALSGKNTREVEVQFRLDPQIPTLFIDPGEMKRALLNLMQNSLTAMANSQKKILTVQTGQTETEVLLTIGDNGHGIPAELWESGKIFEPFFTTRESGTGLGLPIALRIIERHGAVLRMKSHPDRGTEVTIAFPKKDRCHD